MPLATPRVPGTRGRLSLALGGRPHSLIALAQVVLLTAGGSPTVEGPEGPLGTLSAALPRGLPGLFTRVAVLLST